MSVEFILFLVFGGICVISALLAISRRQPVFGVLYLFVLGVSVAGLFALKNAFFLGLIQIIVYVGAVLVLFVFVIAMMNLRGEELIFGRIPFLRFIFIIPPILIFVVGLSVLLSEPSLYQTHFKYFLAEHVAEKLYKDLFFQFELLSVFLLLAIVATVFIGMKMTGEKK